MYTGNILDKTAKKALPHRYFLKFLENTSRPQLERDLSVGWGTKGKGLINRLPLKYRSVGEYTIS